MRETWGDSLSKRFVFSTLGAIVLVWLGLTLWNIDWGLPARSDYIRSYYADESYVFLHVSQMRPENFFSPERFSNGSFYFFVAAAGTALAYVLGFASAAGRALYEASPNLVTGLYASTRLTYDLFAFLSIPLVYGIGRELYGKRAGLFSSALFAITPFFVMKCHIIKEDKILLFFLLLSVYAAVRAWKKDASEFRWLLFSGLAIGFATATKWLGILFVWVPLLAFFLGRFEASDSREEHGWELLKRRQTWVKVFCLVGMMAVGFVILCPYVILTPQAFLDGAIGQQLGTSRIGGAFSEPAMDSPLSFTVSNFLLFHLLNLGQHGLGWPLFALSALGLVWALFILKKSDVLILSVSFFWFLFMGRWKAAIVSYDLIAVPFLMLLTGRMLAALCDASNRKGQRIIWTAVLVFVLLSTFIQTAAYVDSLGFPRTQDRLNQAIWEEDLPRGMIADAEAFNWWSPPTVSEIYPRGDLFYSAEALADSAPVAVITHDYVRRAYEATPSVFEKQNSFIHALRTQYTPIAFTAAPGWGPWRYEKKTFCAPFWEATLGPDLTLWISKSVPASSEN